MALLDQVKEPLYSRIGTATKKWTGQECGTMVQQLAQSVKSITDSAIKAERSNTKSVEKDAKAKKSGGMWDQLTSGPLASYRSQMAAFVDDPTFVANSEGDFLDQFYNYMDLGAAYAGTAANLVSNVVDNVVDELGVINAVTESAGLGSLVPSGQRAGCDKTLVVGTVGTIATIAQQAVSGGLSAVFSAQATIGMGLNAVGDFYAGLMSMPAGYLSVLVTNRKALLERIQGTVEQAVKFARTLTDKDYPFDHQSFIREMQAKLEEADSDLGQLEGIVAAGGKFQATLWDRAEDTVKEVADELLGANADVQFRLSLLKLYGYQRFLETQVKLLSDRQSIFARLVANIGNFKTSISSTNMQSLAAPVIQQARCQIEQVSGDMTRTMDVNALLKYIVNERRWGAELGMVYTFMKSMKELTKNLTKPSTGLNDAADSLSDSLSVGGDSIVAGETYDKLTALLNSFINEVKRKVARNVGTEILEGMLTAITREIDALKKSTGSLDQILNGFNSSIASAGAGAMQFVYAVMGVLGDQGLDTIVNTIREGDIASLFSTNSIVGQLEGLARKNIGEALQCCSQNAGDGDAAKRLIKMNGALANIQKAKAIYDRYTLSYAGEYVKNVTEKTIPAWKEMQSDVTRVSRAPCMNKGQKGAGVQLGLTLI